MKNYILVEEQYSVTVSEHYINLNSTHRAHWLGFDLKVFSSIYLGYQLHCIFYLQLAKIIDIDRGLGARGLQ